MTGLASTVQAALYEPLGMFLLGIVVGSYLNAVALRWGKRGSARSRSQCPHCHHTLRWWELVPLVSYVGLRGRCARCDSRISPRYPLVELMTGIVFALVIGVDTNPLQTLALLVVASLFIVLALIDAEQGILPDQLTLGGAGAVLAYLLFTGNASLIPHSSALGLNHWLWGGLVGVGALGLLVAVTRGRGMGLGDVKLGALIGVSLGGPLTVLALWVAFLCGAVVGLALIALKRAQWRGTELSFGPFLALGWLVAVRWGEGILAWYTGL